VNLKVIEYPSVEENASHKRIKMGLHLVLLLSIALSLEIKCYTCEGRVLLIPCLNDILIY